MEDYLDKINLLQTLFRNLPESLPQEPPESALQFDLDEEFILSEGWGPEFNRRMEIAWRSYIGPIAIEERGIRLERCIKLFKVATTRIQHEKDRETWIGGWLDKLISAAKSTPENTPNTPIVISESDTDNELLGSEAPDVSSDGDPECERDNTIARQTNSEKPMLLLNGKLNFQRLPKDVYLEQSAERAKTLKANREARAAAARAREEEKGERKKIRERERKRTYRQRKREKQASSSGGIPEGISANLENTTLTADPILDAELARATERLLHTNPKQKGKKPQDETNNKTKTRTCWQQPGLWAHIIGAVRAEGIEYARKHPSAIIKRLRITHRDTKLFDKLDESTLGRWFATDVNGRTCWSDAVLARVARESKSGGHGQSKKLSQYPLVVSGATQQLRAIRLTSTPVTCAIARSVIMGHIRMHAPDLVGSSMSDRWLQKFMRDQLGWSYRTATKASRKRPADWEHQGLLAFLRMAKAISQYGVKSPRMIVNADQTGISLFPTGNKTWDICGAKQVSTPNHDEKRQYTIVVASSCGGDILPVQSVWGGTTAASLPRPSASRWSEAESHGFTYAHGDNRHWSSPDSTKKWVVTTLLPHYEAVRKAENLPPDSPGILFIDAWPVHTAKSDPDFFLPWILRTHPEIKIVFVPAGCTGEFQPADTLLQRIVKHVIKQAALDYFVACSTRQLKAGVTPENVKLSNDLPTLRDASVAWTLEAFLYLKERPALVTKAWEKCKTGEWSFTWEKLTSPEATACFYSTLANNESFRNELSVAGPIMPKSTRRKGRTNADPNVEELDEARIEFGNAGDDVSIPVGALVDILTNNSVSHDVVASEDGGLVRVGDEEDIEYAGAAIEDTSSLANPTPVQSNTEAETPSIGGSTLIAKANTQPESVSPVGAPHVGFATDIAVLGGTHPAALVDPGISAKTARPSGAQKRKRLTEKSGHGQKSNKKSSTSSVGETTKGKGPTKRARSGTTSKSFGRSNDAENFEEVLGCVANEA